MKLEEILSWKETRITLNNSHQFWAQTNPLMEIKGKFVEDCLWFPYMYYAGADEIISYSPTPTSVKGAPFQYFLNYTGEVVAWMHLSQLTLSCAMEFTWYPFDIQVNEYCFSNLI